MNSGKFYASQLEKQRQLKVSLSKKANFFSTVRVVVFILFITVIVYELNERALQPAIWLTLLLIIVLAVLISFHNKVKAQLSIVVNFVNLLNIEIEKQKGNYTHIEGAIEFTDELHPNSSDLDLFGNKSIFQFINQTTSFFGKSNLALWLLNKAETNEILKRQAAAKELSENQFWCFKYRASGLSEHIEKKHIVSFNEWLAGDKKLIENTFLKRAIIILPSLFLLIAIGSFMFDYTLYTTAPILIVSGILLSKQHKYASKTVNETYDSLATLQVLANQLIILENSSFSSDYLDEIKKSISSTQIASKEIKRLHLLLDNLQSRNSMMHAFINIPFMLDIRWLIKLEEWRSENAVHVEKWFDSLAKTESLISLSGLYYNHPEWVMPTFTESTYFFKATELTHPLLGKGGVSNNFSFSSTGNCNLITGPNMAGKSTFLRTVATSYVLAQMGAPVNAKEFVVNPSPLIFTTMRVKDNLSESVSSFYAELDRIKQLIVKINSGEQCLYFLDEILKGTNSADRHKGAEALIRQLHKLEATGFVSTHDLELGELASKDNFVKNFSFESDIKEGVIMFDYTIKEGICSSFNACELMRQMGIEV